MIWKQIPGWEGLYEISNEGQIRSLYFKKPKIIKQRKDRDGYWVIILCKNYKAYNFFVHRLLAITFIPNPNNYQFINHKNENKSDNNLSNLEWCTREYNCNYGTGKIRAHQKQCKKIICRETNQTFNSLREASEYLSCSKSKLCCIIKHKQGFYKGKHYEYI